MTVGPVPAPRQKKAAASFRGRGGGVFVHSAQSRRPRLKSGVPATRDRSRRRGRRPSDAQGEVAAPEVLDAILANAQDLWQGSWVGERRQRWLGLLIALIGIALPAAAFALPQPEAEAVTDLDGGRSKGYGQGAVSCAAEIELVF